MLLDNEGELENNITFERETIASTAWPSSRLTNPVITEVWPFLSLTTTRSSDCEHHHLVV
jgi:hypothetical protein